MDTAVSVEVVAPRGRFNDILKDGGVLMNLEEWKVALKGGQRSRIESAKAFFKYDISKRYANDYKDFMPFIEKVVLEQQ